MIINTSQPNPIDIMLIPFFFLGAFPVRTVLLGPGDHSYKKTANAEGRESNGFSFPISPISPAPTPWFRYE